MGAFNDKALIICVPAVVVGFMVQHSMHTSTLLAECAGGLYASLADFLFRITAKLREDEWLLLDPDAGGNIYYIPVWIFGLLWIVYSVGHFYKFW